MLYAIIIYALCYNYCVDCSSELKAHGQSRKNNALIWKVGQPEEHPKHFSIFLK